MSDLHQTVNLTSASKLWLLNFVGNAALLTAAYGWLQLPDAHGWQVGASAVLAIVIIFFGLWLRTGTLAHFRLAEFRESSKLWPTFRNALRHLLTLLLWAIVFAVVEWCLYKLRTYAPQFGVWFWQKLPSALRVATPRHMMQAADWILWLLSWVVVPALWLPVATTTAAVGLFRRQTVTSWRVLRRFPYWVWLYILLLIGACIPYKLIGWVPDLSTLRRQAWSMGLRFFAAYIIIVTTWLALVWMVGSRVETEDAQPVQVGGA